jgi:putative acetyltransferase
VEVVIAVDDPRAEDVRRLLERHLSFSAVLSPAEHVHALDLDGLLDPRVTLFSARDAAGLLGFVALKALAATHGELKSMHVTEEARRQGIGRALLDHLLAVAADRGYSRVSLETGAMEAYAPARSLYRKAGFRTCAPFGGYTSNPYSLCMSVALTATHRPRR